LGIVAENFLLGASKILIGTFKNIIKLRLQAAYDSRFCHSVQITVKFFSEQGIFHIRADAVE